MPRGRTYIHLCVHVSVVDLIELPSAFIASNFHSAYLVCLNHNIMHRLDYLSASSTALLIGASDSLLVTLHMNDFTVFINSHGVENVINNHTHVPIPSMPSEKGHV